MVLTRTSARLFGRFKYGSTRNAVPKDTATEVGQSVKMEISGSPSKIPALNITSQLGRSSPSSAMKSSKRAKTGNPGKRITPIIKRETIQVTSTIGSYDSAITAKKVEILNEDDIGAISREKAKKKEQWATEKGKRGRDTPLIGPERKRKRESDMAENALENIEFTDSANNKAEQSVKAQKKGSANLQGPQKGTRNGGKAKDWVRKSVPTKGPGKTGTSRKKKDSEAEQEILEGDKIPKPKLKKAKKLLTSLHSEENLPVIQKKASKIYEQLMEQYVDPPCPLDHANAFQLLCSVILSAQSTDKKVNEIVPPLYKIAPDAASMAQLDAEVIEEHIRKIGLAPTKAKNIKSMSQALVDRHGGEVPATFEELEQLAGVGHKTASVILAVGFNQATFPVDTHIFRLGLRWGLTSAKTVEQAEADLKVCWPEEHWNALHLRLIYFGREFCSAQKHDPSQCSICSWAAVPPYNVMGHSPARAGKPNQISKPAE